MLGSLDSANVAERKTIFFPNAEVTEEAGQGRPRKRDPHKGRSQQQEPPAGTGPPSQSKPPHSKAAEQKSRLKQRRRQRKGPGPAKNKRQAQPPTRRPSRQKRRSKQGSLSKACLLRRSGPTTATPSVRVPAVSHLPSECRHFESSAHLPCSHSVL